MIVDAHTHVFLADSAAYPWDRSFNVPLLFEASAESLIAAMEKAGVNRAVIIQHSCYGYDNRYILDCARRYPDCFCAVVKVDPLGRDSAERLTRLVEEHGVQGLRLQPAREPDSTWLCAPETYPLWETAIRLGIIIGILLEPRQLGQAEQIISRYPEAHVIIDHMGRVNISEPPDGPRFQQLLDLARFPNVSVKVSAFYAFSQQPFPYPDMTPYVEALWQHFGRERLMWATDFPLSVRAGEDYAQATTLLQYHLPHLSDDDQAWLMGKTVSHLFRFNGASL